MYSHGSLSGSVSGEESGRLAGLCTFVSVNAVVSRRLMHLTDHSNSSRTDHRQSP